MERLWEDAAAAVSNAEGKVSRPPPLPIPNTVLVENSDIVVAAALGRIMDGIDDISCEEVEEDIAATAIADDRVMFQDGWMELDTGVVEFWMDGWMNVECMERLSFSLLRFCLETLK